MKMTEQEMIDSLNRRVESVCRLSLQVSAKGIAHCFTRFYGHTRSFDADAQSASTVYKEGYPRDHLAKLSVELFFHDFLDQPGKVAAYQKKAEQLDEYINTLQSLMKNKANEVEA